MIRAGALKYALALAAFCNARGYEFRRDLRRMQIVCGVGAEIWPS